MEFTNFKKEIQTLNYAELNMLISDIMLEIKKRSYNEGMVKAMTSFGSSVEEEAPTKSPQQLRDEIVEKAKMDVADFGGLYNFLYVVNAEKRTVVALWFTNGVKAEGKHEGKHVLINRGIAKCDPSDCFNVHIGKAIALRRALGLEVPTEYYNAPQPTEVRVGDVVHRLNIDDTVTIRPTLLRIENLSVEVGSSKIIDDSREEVTE
jgi:hypothetical protein